MSMSYLDTLNVVDSTGEAGLAYAKITKAMRVHVRSLVNDGIVAVYAKGTEESTTLDDPKALVYVTESGASYVDELRSAGLLSEVPAKPVRAPRARRARRTTRQAKPRTVVPTALESVSSPVLPEGTVAVRVQGNQHGDQLVVVPTPSSDSDRMDALERKMSALLAAMNAMA
jgi:hypothetical protein